MLNCNKFMSVMHCCCFLHISEEIIIAHITKHVFERACEIRVKTQKFLLNLRDFLFWFFPHFNLLHCLLLVMPI